MGGVPDYTGTYFGPAAYDKAFRILGVSSAIPTIIFTRGSEVEVWYLDPATGNTRYIGLTGTDGTGGLAKDSSDALYGVVTNEAMLVTIDPITGVATNVIKLDNIDLSIRGLTFDSGDYLFAIHSVVTGDEITDTLYKINIATGSTTLVGDTGLYGLQSLATAPNGTIYSWDNGFCLICRDMGLVTINPLTGQAKDVNIFDNDDFKPDLQTLAFAPDGTLWGIGHGNLYSIDTATGEATMEFFQLGIGGTGGSEFIVVEWPPDEDGDGYSPPDDCNDYDDTVYPGATEVCDGQDNDCNGLSDEGFNIGELCSAGVGACEAIGVTVCSADGTGTICNAVPGVPTPELCDGVDNDCDGPIDEDFNPGEPCSAGVGACEAFGVTVCSADGTRTVCDAVPGTPSEEVCDGIDNDCDGEVDEGVQNTYYRDADGDSWGNGLNVCGLACTAPEGCVDNKDDCDDNTNLIGYCNTPPSDNPVTVTYEDEDGGVKLTFTNVTSGGDTTVTAITGCSLDVPAGYTLNLSNLCYDIQSDASFDGSVEICITFDLGSIPDPPGVNGVVILRCDSTGGNCVPLLDISSLDIDLGEGTGTLCVLTEELSFFTVAIEPDSDFDGWSDSRDNCPNAFNPSQSDEDEDGIGNACDNCPNVWDPSNQCDLCEGDFYEDGDVDGLDVAHLAANPGYLDLALFAVNFGRANCPIPKRQCSGALSYDTGDTGWH